ncbi:LysE family translocator [Pelagibius marinus]|uniref:LysE family translocator n=1 Tax=Pelagibius marinus TaxID=2762760 RepID=UPI00187225C1|nr:LysE family translocator [Pelagibius marinus]
MTYISFFSSDWLAGNLGVIALVGGVWTVTVLSPGPNLLATLHATARGGVRAGVATAAGIGLGTTLWSGGSLIGLAALFEAFTWAYTAVKIAGAAYLIVVGLRLLLQRRGKAQAAAPSGEPPVGLRRAFLFGMATDLANPKAAAFFASLFAVSVPAGASFAFQAGICALVVAIAVAWYAVAALLFARPRVAAAYARLRGVIERITGALFVAAGLRLAAGRT